MFDTSGRKAGLRLSMIAGAAALALGSLTATAQAFPAGPVTVGGTAMEPVQYYHDGNAVHHMGRHHRLDPHRYGMNYHPNHPGHAGLYDCGPGGKNTHLSRRACGGNDRFAHLKQYGHYGYYD